QTQFEDSTQPAKTSVQDWAGQAITITNDGVNPLSGTGGIEVTTSPTATKITASAVFAAHADDDKKADADATIKDLLGTFVIEESANGITVKCGHGNAHGTSNAAGSGCKIIRVTIPAGSATQPLDLTIGGGNGDIHLSGDETTVTKLLVSNNGIGDVTVKTKTVPGATLDIHGDGAVAVALPADFSTQAVDIRVDEADPAKAAARLHSEFTDLNSGSPYPASGATPTAIMKLTVQSTGPFDSDTITISKF
ncbi:MAG: hypothetical protein QOI41_1707, partial [Myxococcales bacterium]|nr:hypothetical protein [Myxococcales bacterium]